MWSIVTYSISYTLNGGSVSGNPTSYNIETATFTLNNPTRTGYTFAGWTGSNGTTAQTSITISKGSIGNKSYTANWTANTYTISYNSGNYIYGLDTDKSTVTDTRIKYSISSGVVTVTSTIEDGYGYVPARVDLVANKTYIFSCTTDGTWGAATSSDTVEAFLMLNGQTTTFYRMASNNNFSFTPTVSGTYWLRLDVNQSGKTHTFSNIQIREQVASETKTYGNTLGTLPTLSRTGFTFNGWYTSASGGTKVTSSTAVPAQNTTYYGQWTVNTYTVTYDVNHLGTNLMSLTTDPSTYAAWSTTLSSAKSVQDSSIPSGRYIKLTFGATTNTNDGVQKNLDTSLTIGKTYTFSVYLKSNKNRTMRIGPQQGGRTYVNVTTEWQKFTYTFTASEYDWTSFIFFGYGTDNVFNEGDILYIHSLELQEGATSTYKTETKSYGSPLGTLPAYVRSGYSSVGWYTAPYGGTQVTSSTLMPAYDVTYYAHFKDTVAPTVSINTTFDNPEEVVNPNMNDEYLNEIRTGDNNAQVFKYGLFKNQTFSLILTTWDVSDIASLQWKISSSDVTVSASNYSSISATKSGSYSYIASGTHTTNIDSLTLTTSGMQYIYIKVTDSAGNATYSKVGIYVYTDLEKFVVLCYNNILARAPEYDGLTYWIDNIKAIQNGTTPTIYNYTGTTNKNVKAIIDTLYGFYESSEYEKWETDASAKKIIQTFYYGALRRVPSSSEISNWYLEDFNKKYLFEGIALSTEALNKFANYSLSDS